MHTMILGSHNTGCLGPTKLLADLPKRQYEVDAIECQFEFLNGYGPNFIYCHGHTKLDLPPFKCSTNFKAFRGELSRQFTQILEISGLWLEWFKMYRFRFQDSMSGNKFAVGGLSLSVIGSRCLEVFTVQLSHLLPVQRLLFTNHARMQHQELKS